MHILAISDFFKVVTMLEIKGPRNHFLSKKCIGRLFHVLKENLLKATILELFKSFFHRIWRFRKENKERNMQYLLQNSKSQRHLCKGVR